MSQTLVAMTSEFLLTSPKFHI